MSLTTRTLVAMTAQDVPENYSLGARPVKAKSKPMSGIPPTAGPDPARHQRVQLVFETCRPSEPPWRLAGDGRGVARRSGGDSRLRRARPFL